MTFDELLATVRLAYHAGRSGMVDGDHSRILTAANRLGWLHRTWFTVHPIPRKPSGTKGVLTSRVYNKSHRVVR